MKGSVRDSIEEESRSLDREGRITFLLFCLVLAAIAVGALVLQLRWFE